MNARVRATCAALRLVSCLGWFGAAFVFAACVARACGQ